MAGQQERPWWHMIVAEARERRREQAEAELLAWWRQQNAQTMTAQELGQAMQKALVCDVPTAPDTLTEVLRIQKELGLR